MAAALLQFPLHYTTKFERVATLSMTDESSDNSLPSTPPPCSQEWHPLESAIPPSFQSRASLPLQFDTDWAPNSGIERVGGPELYPELGRVLRALHSEDWPLKSREASMQARKQSKTPQSLNRHSIANTPNQPAPNFEAKNVANKPKSTKHTKTGQGVRRRSYSDAEKPYVCPVDGCGLRYRYKGDLKVHCNSKHIEHIESSQGGTVRNSTGKEKPFRCPVPSCQSAYSYKRDLIRHVHDRHPKAPIEVLMEISIMKPTRSGFNINFDSIAESPRNEKMDSEEREGGGLSQSEDPYELSVDHRSSFDGWDDS